MHIRIEFYWNNCIKKKKTHIHPATFIDWKVMHTQEASSVLACVGGPSGRGRLAAGWRVSEGPCAGLLGAAKGGGPVLSFASLA